jgi:HTH-type transcriptional regulator/antitoxin HigA
MPLKDEVDLDNAQEITDRLAVLDQRTADQDAYLETLSVLIERYEAVHHAVETRRADPISNLRFLLRQHGMSASDLGEVLGQRQLGSKVLKGKRQLSKAHILALCRYFKVGPGAFLKVS